jgi:hypothetical protein
VVFIGVEKVNKVLRQKLVGFQTDHRTADSDSPLTGMAASNPPFKTRRNPYAIRRLIASILPLYLSKIGHIMETADRLRLCRFP